MKNESINSNEPKWFIAIDRNDIELLKNIIKNEPIDINENSNVKKGQFNFFSFFFLNLNFYFIVCKS